MRSMRSQATAEPDDDKVVALPDPGLLTDYGNQFGTKLAFTVTGNAGNAGGLARRLSAAARLGHEPVHVGFDPGDGGCSCRCSQARPNGCSESGNHAVAAGLRRIDTERRHHHGLGSILLWSIPDHRQAAGGLSRNRQQR